MGTVPDCLCKRFETLSGTQRNLDCVFYWVYDGTIQHPLLEAQANVGWVLQSSQESLGFSLVVAATGQIHQPNVTSIRTKAMIWSRFRRFLGPAPKARLLSIYVCMYVCNVM